MSCVDVQELQALTLKQKAEIEVGQNGAQLHSTELESLQEKLRVRVGRCMCVADVIGQVASESLEAATLEGQQKEVTVGQLQNKLQVTLRRADWLRLLIVVEQASEASTDKLNSLVSQLRADKERNESELESLKAQLQV